VVEISAETGLSRRLGVTFVFIIYFTEMPYKLLSEGKLEKEAFRGDVDLIDKHKLTRIVKLVLAGESKVGEVGDYLENVPHAKEFRK